ncbi:MAG: response regulator [Gammaproteobacteria bacterium]|nr:response regulator [Gammaproteobacteria bacterium]
MTDSKPIVLAVDDTPSNLDLLNGVLSTDYKVKAAISGEKALELAKRKPIPDIILLDIMMPGMSGHEVCEILKQNPETAPIPVIFVTAMSQTEDEQQGLALGAVDYITKPFNHDIVKARVSAHLKNYEKTRELIRENRALRENKGPSFKALGEPELLVLIKAGESHSVEFKSTMRWNLYADRSDKGIENSSLKTVAAYLNTEGGVLLVGVDDDGEVLGLGKDHFKTEDKQMLHWVNLVKSYLGAEFIPYMRSTIESIGDKRVLVVECLPSKKPVFFRRDNDESFFVRMTNTTQALKTSETLAYIEEHFAARQTQTTPPAEEAAQTPVKDTAETNLIESTSNQDREPQSQSALGEWLNELMERHVIRTAVIYFIVAWALTKSGTMIAETLEAPGWVNRFIVLVFIAGFPVAVLLSWLYDIRVMKDKSIPSPSSSKKTIWMVVIPVLLSIATIMAYLKFG